MNFRLARIHIHTYIYATSLPSSHKRGSVFSLLFIIAFRRSCGSTRNVAIRASPVAVVYAHGVHYKPRKHVWLAAIYYIIQYDISHRQLTGWWRVDINSAPRTTRLLPLSLPSTPLSTVSFAFHRTFSPPVSVISFFFPSPFLSSSLRSHRGWVKVADRSHLCYIFC